jgi:hypothetical protein
MNRRIHILLDEETILKLEALSLQQDRSLSNMIRVLLKEALKDRKIPSWYKKDGTISPRAEKLLSKYRVTAKTPLSMTILAEGSPVDDIIAKYEEDQDLD